jgi:hypothetical protein
MKGFLLNIECLGFHWLLIDQLKFTKYRGNRDITGKIPTATEPLSLLDLNTLKLACRTIYTKTADNKNMLIEKEFSLAATKLFQQFQILLTNLKHNFEPHFGSQAAKKTHSEERGVTAVLHSWLGLGSDSMDEEQRKREERVLQDEEKLLSLRDDLKRFERTFRIFEMTYIDLTNKLNHDLMVQNLKIGQFTLDLK